MLILLPFMVVCLLTAVVWTPKTPDAPPTMTFRGLTNDAIQGKLLVLQFTNHARHFILLKGVAPPGQSSNEVGGLLYPRDVETLAFPISWLHETGRLEVSYTPEERRRLIDLLWDPRHLIAQRRSFYFLTQEARGLLIEDLTAKW